jgi:glucose/arabinose dehydrogenase
VRAQIPEIGPSFGQLYKLSRHRGVRAVADIAAYEAEANPDGGLPDSNPHSVTTRWGKPYVADAGGNSLLKVSRHGDISTVAVFPDQPVAAPPGLPPMAQAVPTSVVVGPDGALYVGQLTGFPFVPGAANVFRIGKDGEVEVYASGFTNVTGIDFDRHGRLYVIEFASNGILSGDPTGALIRVNPDGSRETLVSEGLVNPTGIVVGRKGDVYVSNHGAEAGAGEVLRFRF